MINIVTWNIQCGRGVDDIVDLARIASVIADFSDADVICMQEVARFDPDMDGKKGTDQFMELAAYFPGYVPVFGAALNRWQSGDQHRRQFGNMILSRLPVIQVFSHMLPRPMPEIPCKHMPRQALEIIVDVPDGPLRITTTHLEFHSECQRFAQIRHLREIQAESVGYQHYSRIAPPSGPYANIAFPVRSIICGDFNAVPDDDIYQAMLAQTGNQHSHYADAWRLVKPHCPHVSTCGIHDHQQWSEGAHCRDFFFLSGELAPFACDIQVQEETNASDHQPVAFTLDIM